MNQRGRVYAASIGTLLLFFTIQLGALALVTPFQRAGLQAVRNPSDPTNSLLYLGAILVATAVFLVAIRLDATWVIRGLIVLSSAGIAFYVFSVLVPPLVLVSVGGAPTNGLALGGALLLALALLFYPEWYVIDAVGIVMGAGAAGLFGISFGLLPAVVLLTVLAVYDAVSVYGTEHMLTLAEGVMDMKVPVVLVIPLSLSYSYLDDSDDTTETDARNADDPDEPTPAAETEAWIKDTPVELGIERATNGGERSVGTESNGTEGEHNDDENDADSPEIADRDVLYIGLGDAVMPTVLVASAAFFSPAPPFDLFGIALNLPALAALVGTLCGLVVLLRLVLEGRAHAGLPLLNGGAIGGYLLGALASGVSVVNALGLGPYL